MKLLKMVFFVLFLSVGFVSQGFAQDPPFPEWVFKNHKLLTWSSAGQLIIQVHNRNWDYTDAYFPRTYPEKAIAVIKKVNGKIIRINLVALKDFWVGTTLTNGIPDKTYYNCSFRFPVSFKREFYTNEDGSPYHYDRPKDFEYQLEDGDKLTLHWWGKRWTAENIKGGSLSNFGSKFQ